MTFYTDERCGKIAVRDNAIKEDTSCLYPTMDSVIAYWNGRQLTKLERKEDPGAEWKIDTWQRDKANYLCDLLNK